MQFIVLVVKVWICSQIYLFRFLSWFFYWLFFSTIRSLVMRAIYETKLVIDFYFLNVICPLESSWWLVFNPDSILRICLLCSLRSLNRLTQRWITDILTKHHKLVLPTFIFLWRWVLLGWICCVIIGEYLDSLYWPAWIWFYGVILYSDDGFILHHLRIWILNQRWLLLEHYLVGNSISHIWHHRRRWNLRFTLVWDGIFEFHC